MPDRHAAQVWLATCAAIALGSVVVWYLPVDAQIALRWRADQVGGAPWLHFTGALTHLSDRHLALNLLGFAALALMGCLGGVSRSAGAHEALALLLAWPLAHAALLLWPQVQMMSGISGLNHALPGIYCASSAIHLIVNRIKPNWRNSGLPLLLAALFITKLLWEQGWSHPLRIDSDWGFTVVQAVHLTGFVAGIAAMCFVAASAYALRILFTKPVVE